ncbi:hypothetical protein HY495_03830 [Candidatus Woesearchaeota archaeon]|nr:hypothetical protein [Candidatus Woesearchaeota archaeon]
MTFTHFNQLMVIIYKNFVLKENPEKRLLVLNGGDLCSFDLISGKDSGYSSFCSEKYRHSSAFTHGLPEKLNK